MCRLLCVSAAVPFEIAPHLAKFARIAESSREYQGHGWGCARIDDGRWHVYRDIRPVWEDERRDFGRTTLLLAHARSAFRDEGIAVENNMPFQDGRLAFIFNGELRGVRIREDGRIGAEKIFNYILRFEQGDSLAGLRKALGIINRRTRYVRAMNLIMACRERIYLASQFSEDATYFQMHIKHTNGATLLCSAPYAGENDWTPVANHTLRCFETGNASCSS